MSCHSYCKYCAAREAITAYREASGEAKLLEYVARIAYRKGAAGVVSFETGEHDIGSTIKGARKWLADDAAIDTALEGK